MGDAVQDAREAAAAAMAAAEEAERLQTEAAAAIRAAQEAADRARAAAAAAAGKPGSAAEISADRAPSATDAATDWAPSAADAVAETAHSTAGAGAREQAGPPPDDTASSVAPTPEAPPAPPAPLDPEQVNAIRSGYNFDAAALELGALVNGDAQPDVQIRIPLAMTNRHGLVAGATGTGKTRTLQVLAEQLSSHGVAVFAADVKGDLSGVATPGEPSEKLIARTRGIGQEWTPAGFPVEYFSLGGVGRGVPIRATLAGFGPLLLAKALGLNATQESTLGLVFHYAEQQGLALLDLADLRSVLTYLVSDEGKTQLASLGGLSKSTVGVILRELIVFADGGAEVFFGEPEIDAAEFLRVASDGRGVISLLEVPGVADRPALYSTFLMWLLADLFNELPEVGDAEKPKLVFFFDEAHLLFADASKDFLAQVVRTVRLIRSKGVGIFFVTQTPKDVPADVLAQLGSRVQHQLRAFTPDDAKALRATVSTFPNSGYELDQVLTTLGTGEAIVTVMNEKGAPSPVAWTRLRAPQGSMAPTPDAAIDAAVAASPLSVKYGTAIDRESAAEILTARMNAAAATAEAAAAAETAAEAQAEAAKQQAKAQADAAKLEESIRKERARQQRAADAAAAKAEREAAARSRANSRVITDVLGSRATRNILTGVLEGILGTRRRR